jgi:L-fuconolactonase
VSVIDSHHHLWDPSARKYPFLEPAEMAAIRMPYRLRELQRQCRASGIDHTILVQTVPAADETAEFLGIADASDGLIAGVVGWVDLTDPDVDDAIAELRAGRGGHLLVGIRHPVQDEDDPDWLVRPEVLRGLHAVADAGLVFDILIRAPQLPMAVSAVGQVPEGRFVLDHAAKPPIATGVVQPWASQLAELAQHPGVYCKLSGLVTEADWGGWTIAHLRPYAKTVFDAFGADRVMFGTDWPVCELAAGHGDVVETARRLTDEFAQGESASVLGDAAARQYALALT